MRKIVYHVATTLDCFIAQEDHSIAGFLPEGDHIGDYLNHLQHYDTVIMGKGTYEFGYQYGMQPGDAPYPHMEHYIFSKTLHFDKAPNPKVHVVRDRELEFLHQLKQTEGTAIYCCGGAAFAGFLLENRLIDELIIKLNPVLFGKGIPLFASQSPFATLPLTLLDTKTYDSGVLLLTYRLNYDA
ncbi:MAG: dihydrofolate reductase family protein [Saprospiraceae bacterium]